MFDVRVEATFHARHAVRGRDGAMEVPHWHAWRVEAVWRGAQLDADGMLIDFLAVQDHMASVLSTIEGTDLNGHEALAGQPASTEIVARTLFDALAPAAGTAEAQLIEIVLHEAPGCSVRYRPGK